MRTLTHLIVAAEQGDGWVVSNPAQLPLHLSPGLQSHVQLSFAHQLLLTCPWPASWQPCWSKLACAHLRADMHTLSPSAVDSTQLSSTGRTSCRKGALVGYRAHAKEASCHTRMPASSHMS